MDYTKILYNDPILYKLRQGINGDEYVSLNETHTVINGKVVLTEIPNRKARVAVTGDNRVWFEVEEGELQENTYKVDYPEGVVFFNSVHHNKSLTILYIGEGGHFIPDSRIYTQATNGKVTETLIDIIKIGRNTYLPPVTNFTDLVPTYPNPKHGWTVQTEIDGRFFRWDDEELAWIHAQTLNTTQLTQLSNKLGELTELKGEQTSTVVSAINENHDKIGNLGLLNTVDKTSLVSALNDNVEQMAQTIQNLKEKELKNKIFKKHVFKKLPIIFPDYDTLMVQEGFSYIYPQSFTIDWEAKEIFILYSPEGGTTKRWVVVYDLDTITYKCCFHAGSAGGEGIVVKKEGSNRYLYVKTTGGKMGKFLLNSLPPNRTSIVPETEYDIGLHWQFSYRKGKWLVEDNGAQLGLKLRRRTFSIYDDDFNRKGMLEIDQILGGFFDSTYTPYVSKRQAIALADGCIVQQNGGFYRKDDPVTPYSYQGLKVLDNTGNLLVDGVVNPASMISTLELNGFTCGRIEAEGMHISNAGDVYSLYVYQSYSMPTSSQEGIVIFQNFTDEGESIDFSSSVDFYHGFNRLSIESGIYPRSSNGKMYDPFTGAELNTMEKIITFMENTDLRKFSFYGTSVSVTDLTGNIIPNSTLVIIYNTNNFTYYIEHIAPSGSRRFMVTGNEGARNQTELVDFQDSGWLNITPTNGASLFDGVAVFQYRRVGKTIHIRGAIKDITTAGTFGNIPSGFRPISVSHQFVMPTSIISTSTRSARWSIGTNGDIVLAGTSDGSYSATHWFPVFTSYLL